MKVMVKFDDEYSTNDREYLKEAINFYLDNTGMREYNFSLYIIFTAEIPDGGVVNKTSATDILVSQGLCVHKAPDKAFVYVYSDQSHENHVKTLFHELCHALQYASGKQKLDNTGRIIWKNTIPYPVNYNISYDSYLSLPWEIEAREHEEIFYNKWAFHEYETKKKFWHEKLLDRLFNGVVYLASTIFAGKSKNEK